MSDLSLQAVCQQIKKSIRMVFFLFYPALLVPGFLFWALLILLHGNMSDLIWVIDNLTSRFGDAPLEEQQHFIQICWMAFAVLYLIILGFHLGHLSRIKGVKK